MERANLNSQLPAGYLELVQIAYTTSNKAVFIHPPTHRPNWFKEKNQRKESKSFYFLSQFRVSFWEQIVSDME